MNNANFFTLQRNENVFVPTARHIWNVHFEFVRCLRISACRDVTVNNVQTIQLCFWRRIVPHWLFGSRQIQIDNYMSNLTSLCVCAWTDHHIYKGPKIISLWKCSVHLFLMYSWKNKFSSERFNVWTMEKAARIWLTHENVLRSKLV